MNKPSRPTRWRRAFLEGRFQRVAGNGSFERPSPNDMIQIDGMRSTGGRAEGQGACRLIPARWAPSPPSCGFGSLERTRDRRPRAARQGSRLGRPSRPRPRWREIGSRRTNFDEVVVGRSQPVLKGPKAPCHQARHQRVATGPIGANGAVTKPSPKTPDRTRGKSTAPVAEIGVVGTILFRHRWPVMVTTIDLITSAPTQAPHLSMVITMITSLGAVVGAHDQAGRSTGGSPSRA